MPVIVVTRLRLKDPALLDEFFTDAVAAIEQAQKSDGNLPRPLQQILVDAADGITPPDPVGTGEHAPVAVSQ
jgi:hypothetical protein